MKLLIGLLMLCGIATLVCYLWPQINFRDMPKGLCTGTPKLPNWVSSLVDKDDSHYIEPLKIKSMSHVADLIDGNVSGVTIVRQNSLNMAFR